MKTFKQFLKERDYAREYENYHSHPDQVKRRAFRNAARRLMRQKHGSKINGKDIHHKDHNPENNVPGNLAIATIAKNRSDNRPPSYTGKRV